ncbi:4-aminobutyrate--2-oxoglutarate transaminase [Pseudomonas sp. SWRI59]|jgi:4-aminobutyrate aminotransferase, prokaryotic type|uniref:4-aminobutyrate--2-oxoglutarate transaminase n=1 Tax=Pseudomonas capeferrum TaxID=1495066 RepID=A0ABY7RG86_9PSED|nr:MULTISPECIES: 4-aminobutyrate--2-oxoglutarate transaminase [Pseudomonas]KEY88380.1 4-aminobutyrate aminotransferase [Pseudomonas capeferrum]KGI91305.1 4-aminobutyrate aminotransferase [Pseudomonas sp. H2]MBC3479508.1 4-aminobutyrate--2-oxoglutarate transaminase [Pseudomonas sp. SWRI77]MBC3502560.1 4-aminobutyrate--2-oxoglutarate transaminase [Pseudomonas sp. SWRI59]MBC3508345.1 4-aminobutyrate--2-oxoglutarate transaminase [Pseudomonas sp. SWRI68]
MSSQQKLSVSARAQHVSNGVAVAHPITVSRAAGAYLWDDQGKKYLDFVGGIGVLNVGHNHPRVVEAVRKQLDTFSHICFQVAAYDQYTDLAAKLNNLVGGPEHYKSVFLTTGAEAVENAIKIARGYTNRPGVIAFRGGFHGRTLMGMTLTGMSQPYRQNFGPYAPDIYHTPYPNEYRGITTEKALVALQEVFDTQIAADRVAAIIIEPVQGDGGFIAAPVEFMRALRKKTEELGIVLICDEIQTGFGRTGKMFGFEHAGIQPDLVTVAKSLAGGLPISGVVGRARIMDAPQPGGLGGTYGGNPLGCAAALEVIKIFESENLTERSRAIGAQLLEGFKQLEGRFNSIGHVRAIGAMAAVEFVSNRDSKEPDAAMAQRVIDAAREEGLLLIKCGVYRNVVRFICPLVITEQDVAKALGMFERALVAAQA